MSTERGHLQLPWVGQLLASISAPTAAAITAAALSSAVLYRRASRAPSKEEDGPHRPQELLDLIEKGEDIYYFGVGSNLSRTRLENRSVCGKKIHPITMEPCFIRHCRLAFNLRALPPVEPAMGSLEPLPSFYEAEDAKEGHHRTIVKRSDSQALVAFGGSECHGALIKLSAHDYELVFRSEGGDLGRMCSYEEIMVKCIPYDTSKQPVWAVAYRVREHARIAVDACPSRRYMTLIRQGAEELGLEESYRKWLDAHPVQETSRITKSLGKNSIVFNFTLSFALKTRVHMTLQGKMLFLVYVLPTAPRWKRAASEVASIVILLPTACLGVALRGVLEASGRMNPTMKKWIESLD
ncbi:hypothetical protein ACHAXT_007544 [Thalassiosira profunda]